MSTVLATIVECAAEGRARAIVTAIPQARSISVRAPGESRRQA